MSNSIRFGRKESSFPIPDVSHIAKVSKDESIVIFGEWWRNKAYRVCVGVGKVMRVAKGERMDLVVMCFGARYSQKIFVTDNHARRQIYTLKKGQYAWFYGARRIFIDENKKPKTTFIAFGFQAWYVPKMVDIKHYDTDNLEDLEQERDLSNFLDEITKGE